MDVKGQHRFSAVVTSFFYVLEHPTPATVNLRPGLDLLAETLVRCAAHKIYIPYSKPRFGPELGQLIKEYPPSLQKRIQLVDTNGEEYGKVTRYLKPIRDEIADSAFLLSYQSVHDFIYKLLLASQYQAEADVSMSHIIPYSIESLRAQVHDGEGKIRLDQIMGICSSYSSPLRIETFTVFPNASFPSICEKIADFLDEAAIIELSKSRHMLGLPGKAKAAMIAMKMKLKHSATERKYQKWFRITSELVQVAGQSKGLAIPDIEHLRDLVTSDYNPPLIDLDYFRVQACKAVSPGWLPNFMLPDGVTRGMTDEYFQFWGDMGWRTR